MERGRAGTLEADDDAHAIRERLLRGGNDGRRLEGHTEQLEEALLGRPERAPHVRAPRRQLQRLGQPPPHLLPQCRRRVVRCHLHATATVPPRRRTQPPARRNHQSDAAVVQRAAQPRIITSREPRQQLPPESPAELHPRVRSPLGLT